jgi:PAS domain S-box-containing protein
MRLRIVTAILALAALASLGVAGWLFFEDVNASAQARAKEELVAATTELKDKVEGLIREYERETRVLARFEELESALKNSSPEALAQANRILSHFAARHPGDVCFLMDGNGNAVASSNHNEPNGFVGHNYSFRPYFTEAMDGRASVYMARGVTSGERGFYFGYPLIETVGARPLGVAVIKASADRLERAVSAWKSRIHMLVHDSGVIFLSSRPSWVLHTLWRVGDDPRDMRALTVRFGPGPWEWTGLERISATQATDRSGNTYLMDEQPLDGHPGWRMVTLCDLRVASLPGAGAPIMGRYGVPGLFAIAAAGIVVLLSFAHKDIHERRRSETELRIRKDELARAVAQLEESAHRQRITEESLRESEAKYRAFFQTSRDCVYMTTLDGRIVECNDAAFELLGYSVDRREELFRRSVADYYANPADREIHANTVAAQGYTKDYPIDLRRSDGTIAHTLVSTVVRKDSKGNIVGFQGIVRDVTEAKKAEEALRASFRRLDQIMEFLPDPTLVIDAQGKVEAWNRAMAELTGVPAEEMVGKGNYEYALPFYGERRPILIDLALKWDEASREKYLSITRLEDGVLVSQSHHPSLRGVYLSGTARALYSEDGEPVGAIESVRDITSIKNAEQALIESERRWTQVIDFLPDPTMVIDASGVVIAWNAAMVALTGVEAREMLGKGNYEYAIPFYGERRPVMLDLALSYNEEIASKYVSYRREGNRLISETYLASFRDRGPTWFWNAAAPIYDRYGAVVGAIEAVRDITELKRAEAELKESREKYKLLVEKAREGIFVVQDTVFRFVNPSVEEMLGVSAEELLGRSFESFVCPEDRPLVLERHRRRSNGEDFPARYSIGLVDAGGRRIRAEIVCVRIQWEGRPAVMVFMTDITYRKVAEEAALQAGRLRAITDLASGVAHNFNNLLQIILGNAVLSLADFEDGNTGSMRTGLENIREAALLGADTVKRLQAFAHVRADAIEADAAVFDVSVIAKNAAELLRPLWKIEPEKKGIQIDLRVNVEDGCMVKGRENEIFEAIVNLVTNAVDALPEGGVIVLATRKEGDEVTITVRDNGIGISQDDIPRVFQPFWSTKGVNIGKGMGLAVTHGLVKRHGGGISVKSAPGEGTTFTIRLPLHKSSDAPTPEPQSGSARGPLTVLVIDDDPSIAALLERICARAGHKVFSATSGEEGVAVFRETPVDIVISDLGMPGMTGWDVGKALRSISIERGIRKPLFVLLTGYGGQELEKTNISESGVDAVEAKPVDVRTVTEIIQDMASRLGGAPPKT